MYMYNKYKTIFSTEKKAIKIKIWTFKYNFEVKVETFVTRQHLLHLQLLCLNPKTSFDILSYY